MESMQTAPKHADTLRYGWVMVVLTPLFIGFANGGLNSMAVFLSPLASDLNWQRGQTAFGYLVGTLAVGLGGIAMGYMADRISLRKVVLVGAISLGAALMILANLHSRLEFYGGYLLLGSLGASAFLAPLVANVGNWFERGKGLAIGVTTAGMGLMNASIVYGTRFLITDLGWRGAYLTLGLLAWGMLLPMTILIRQPPREANRAAARLAQDGSATAAGPPIAPSLAVGWMGMAVIFC